MTKDQQGLVSIPVRFQCKQDTGSQHIHKHMCSGQSSYNCGIHSVKTLDIASCGAYQPSAGRTGSEDSMGKLAETDRQAVCVLRLHESAHRLHSSRD